MKPKSAGIKPALRELQDGQAAAHFVRDDRIYFWVRLGDGEFGFYGHGARRCGDPTGEGHKERWHKASATFGRKKSGGRRVIK